MADMPKYFGLCETCDYDATCTLRRSNKLEIIQCEEFSNQPAAQKAMAAQNQTVIPDQIEAARMGLCANCLNVVTCGFPNARQGVLQCEEYVLDADGVIPAAAKAERSKSAA